MQCIKVLLSFTLIWRDYMREKTQKGKVSLLVQIDEIINNALLKNKNQIRKKSCKIYWRLQ